MLDDVLDADELAELEDFNSPLELLDELLLLGVGAAAGNRLANC